VRAAIQSAEALEARSPKLPSGKFSDNTVKLMLRVCEEEHETQPLPYWSDLANCAKGETRILLQAALTARVAETDSASLITPIATKEMVERLNHIEFAGQMKISQQASTRSCVSKGRRVQPKAARTCTT
jgi:hypothetical protein